MYYLTRSLLAVLFVSAIQCGTAKAQWGGGWGIGVVPHTTTHYDRVRHGNHYHAVPHTQTHYDLVPQIGGINLGPIHIGDGHRDHDHGGPQVLPWQPNQGGSGGGSQVFPARPGNGGHNGPVNGGGGFGNSHSSFRAPSGQGVARAVNRLGLFGR